MTRLAPDETESSATVSGDARNYDWPATFDRTGDGYVGITQTHDDGMIERVLLSPKQVKALLKVVAP